MKKLLLHTCCAPCSPHVIAVLHQEFEVTAFFYNPNIHPREEYDRRLRDLEQYCQKHSVLFVAGEYDTDEWFCSVKGLEELPEGGQRCERCYRLRLEKTADRAQSLGFGYFATTLTVSPHKKATVINRIGREAGEGYAAIFYEADFKKGDGFKKSCELSKRYDFYRQTYCGCVYSIPGKKV